MDSIVRRLKESRDIQLAKSILENAGYKIAKKSKRIKEDVSTIRQSNTPKRNIKNTEPEFNSLFREFEKYDWYGYSGASALPDGTGPFINKEGDETIIVSGSEDEKGGATVDLVYGENSDEYYNTFRSVELAKQTAVGILKDLNSGVELDKILTKYDLRKA